MLAISHRHGDHSNAINTLPGNLFFDIWHFKEDLLCYLLEYPNTRDWLISQFSCKWMVIQSSLQRTWHGTYHRNKYTLTTFMSMLKHNKVPHWFPCDKHLPLQLLKVRVGYLEYYVTMQQRWKHWPRLDHLIYSHRPRRLRRPSHCMKEGRKEHIYLTKRETTIQYIFMKMQWSGDCR